MLIKQLNNFKNQNCGLIKYDEWNKGKLSFCFSVKKKKTLLEQTIRDRDNPTSQ